MRTIIILILLSGCAAKVTTSSTTIEKDSLGVKTIHHHDTVRVKGETVFVDRVIHDTVSFTIIKKEGRATETITNKHGVLTGKCKCDSIQKALNIAIQDTTKYKTRMTTIIKTVTKNHTSGFDWFCRGIFFLLVILIAGLTLNKLGIFKIPFI